MKLSTFLILIFLILSVKSAFSQVPNGDFENWSFVDGFDTPVGWETNNFHTYEAVSKTSDSHSGDFAMIVNSKAWGFEGYDAGRAWTTFIPFLNGGIAVYVKCDSLSGIAEGRITLVGYHNGNVIPYIGTWLTQTEIPDFTRIEIPVTSTETYDSIRIHIMSLAGFDGQGNQLGYASIIIDDITEIQSNGLSEVNKSAIQIYPNPFTDELMISVENKNSPVHI